MIFKIQTPPPKKKFLNPPPLYKLVVALQAGTRCWYRGTRLLKLRSRNLSVYPPPDIYTLTTFSSSTSTLGGSGGGGGGGGGLRPRNPIASILTGSVGALKKDSLLERICNDVGEGFVSFGGSGATGFFLDDFLLSENNTGVSAILELIIMFQ